MTLNEALALLAIYAAGATVIFLFMRWLANRYPNVGPNAGTTVKRKKRKKS